jgi:hypothetical protein
MREKFIKLAPILFGMLNYSAQVSGDPGKSLAENARNYIDGGVLANQLDPALSGLMRNGAKIGGYSMFHGFVDIRDVYRSEVAGRVEPPLKPFLKIAIEWDGAITKDQMKELIGMRNGEYYAKNVTQDSNSFDIKLVNRQIHNDTEALYRIFGLGEWLKD